MIRVTPEARPVLASMLREHPGKAVRITHQGFG